MGRNTPSSRLLSCSTYRKRDQITHILTKPLTTKCHNLVIAMLIINHEIEYLGTEN